MTFDLYDLSRSELRTTAVGEPRVASLHVNTLYSPDKKASWGRLATEFVEASREAARGKKGRLQTFVNTTLGETWSLEEADKIGAHDLAGLVEPYQAEVPAGVVSLYAGFDFQEGQRGSGGYAEAKVMGLGPAGERISVIGHWVLNQVPMSDPTWPAYMAEFLNRTFRGADGRTRRIHAAALDTGYNQERVLSLARDYEGHVRLYPIKGANSRTGVAWPRSASNAKERRGQFHTICVSSIKDNHRSTRTSTGPSPIHGWAATQKLSRPPRRATGCARSSPDSSISPGGTHEHHPQDRSCPRSPHGRGASRCA